MTPAELARLRGVLEVRQAELEEQVRNREVIAIDSNPDMIDQIQHASERDMAVGHLERESARLREVRAALRRIHLGTFGICLDCEEEISQKRLAAVPWTATCIVCRETMDRSQVMPENGFENKLLSVGETGS